MEELRLEDFLQKINNKHFYIRYNNLFTSDSCNLRIKELQEGIAALKKLSELEKNKYLELKVCTSSVNNILTIAINSIEGKVYLFYPQLFVKDSIQTVPNIIHAMSMVCDLYKLRINELNTLI
jgi:hypothetical protein